MMNIRISLSAYTEQLALTRHKLQLRQYGLDIAAGLMVGLMVIITAASFATLIFSGPLGSLAAVGISIALFSTAVLSGLMALRSSGSVVIAGPQSGPVVVLAMIAPAVANHAAATTSHAGAILTIIVALALSGLLTGGCAWLLGWLQLGQLVRAFPYPVIGGFMVTTGWLMAQGALDLLTAAVPFQAGIAVFLRSEGAILLAGIGVAAALTVAQRSFRHPLTLPSMLLIAIMAFHAILQFGGATIAGAQATGWLFAPPSMTKSWHALHPAAVSEIDWRAILNESGYLVTVVAVSLISALLNAVGIELNSRDELDLSMDPLPEPDQGVDVLISQFAGFVSQHCRRYLRIGGLLVANDSHGDASMAALDPSYVLRGGFTEQDDAYRLQTSHLESYFIPRRGRPVTRDDLERTQRGIDYTYSAGAYLFQRVA